MMFSIVKLIIVGEINLYSIVLNIALYGWF